MVKDEQELINVLVFCRPNSDAFTFLLLISLTSRFTEQIELRKAKIIGVVRDSMIIVAGPRIVLAGDQQGHGEP